MLSPTRSRAVALALCLLTSASLAAKPAFRIQPTVARPGDPVVITVRGTPVCPTGLLGDRALSFKPIKNGCQAITGLSVDLAPGTLPLKLQRPAGEGWPAATFLEGTLDVRDPQFPSRELTVARKFTATPSRQTKRRMAEDKASFTRGFSQPDGARKFDDDFTWPRPKDITAPFGDLRLFNGKKQSQHFGVDLDGKVGDPIVASNSGTVVMVRDCYASGNTVLLHHGADLYTAYFHLSKFLVKEGTTVKRGQKLGLVGSTGRVTGPHLHFGVKVAGLWVNAETLLELEFE